MDRENTARKQHCRCGLLAYGVLSIHSAREARVNRLALCDGSPSSVSLCEIVSVLSVTSVPVPNIDTMRVRMSERIPAIKVLLLPKDTNAYGTIFGGVIL